ncbi:MAG: DUF1272 domain-containing protein [Gammaproteobacteria bacterium]
MLELKPNCECCDKDLPPASDEAVICSFECTFCRQCATGKLNNVCPNCSGNLVSRPIRPEAALARFPASTQRVVHPERCGG